MKTAKNKLYNYTYHSTVQQLSHISVRQLLPSLSFPFTPNRLCVLYREVKTSFLIADTTSLMAPLLAASTSTVTQCLIKSASSRHSHMSKMISIYHSDRFQSQQFSKLCIFPSFNVNRRIHPTELTSLISNFKLCSKFISLSWSQYHT